LAALLLHHTDTMAKRKQDPEELPDAPESKGKGKKQDDESDSDEVWRIPRRYSDVELIHR